MDNSIQVDVFDVQLGAAMLLQFRDDLERPVRVLADGGSPHHDASDYPPERVLGLLEEAFAAFGDTTRRLDLIIGTHYDADHLKGLEPIAADESVEIGEAWLPPVVNDTDPGVRLGRVRTQDFLAHQMAQSDGDDVLVRYQAAKLEVCNRIRDLELSIGEPSAREKNWSDPDGDEDVFARHVREARAALGVRSAALDDHGNSDPHVDDGAQSAWQWRVWDLADTKHAVEWTAKTGSKITQAALRQELALIRAAEAKKAINAKALNNLVKALAARKIPMQYRFIEPGEPATFGWRSAERRFAPSNAALGENLRLTLIGPSRALVDKHRDIIPQASLQWKLGIQQIPIEGVTPSNQLSYALVFESRRQRILVSGDTGFDDFRSSRTEPYFDALLQALKPLHIVQVSHHGGANSHFYRVLEAADYRDQPDPAYLTVSHATDDPHRPSATFDLFIGRMRRPRSHLNILFTGRPDPERAKNFLDLIVPVTPSGPGADRGDARLSFGKRWRVVRHAVGL